MTRVSFSNADRETIASNTFIESHSELDDSDSVPQSSDVPKSPPEGGYGWVCVGATFLINMHTWGINSAYGVLLAFYLSDQTFPNTTPLDYAFVGGLSIAAATLVSPLATYMVHHYGIRIVLCLGAILVTTSLITTSFVQTNWQLFLSQGICFGIGMGFCFVGSVGVVSHWFERRRSLVNGIAAAGSGIGGLTYSLAIGAMIPRLGYPWAMRILGVISFVVNVVFGCLLRLPHEPRPHAKQPAMQLSIFRRFEYVFFIAWGVLSCLGYVALLFSLSSYAVAVGLSQHQGSIISAIFNLGQALGRPMVGILSDSLGRVNVAFTATLLAGILSLAVWVFAQSMGVICFFAVTVGLFAGTIWATAAPLGAEIVGLSNLHSALGFFWLALAPPLAVSEAIAIQLRDGVGANRPYLRVQLFTGFMYVGAAICLAFLKILLAQSSRDDEKPRAKDHARSWYRLRRNKHADESI